MPMSVFGQTAMQPATVPALPAAAQSAPARQASHVPAAIANGTPLLMEDAVKMALENNLGVQAERLNPEIHNWALARANVANAPNLISSFQHSNSASPPADFFSSGQSVTTNGATFSQGGLQQQTRWGGSYQVTFDGSRGTTDATGVVYPLSLKSDFNAVVNQPLLR